MIIQKGRVEEVRPESAEIILHGDFGRQTVAGRPGGGRPGDRGGHRGPPVLAYPGRLPLEAAVEWDPAEGRFLAVFEQAEVGRGAVSLAVFCHRDDIADE